MRKVKIMKWKRNEREMYNWKRKMFRYNVQDFSFEIKDLMLHIEWIYFISGNNSYSGSKARGNSTEDIRKNMSLLKNEKNQSDFLPYSSIHCQHMANQCLLSSWGKNVTCILYTISCYSNIIWWQINHFFKSCRKYSSLKIL